MKNILKKRIKSPNTGVGEEFQEFSLAVFIVVFLKMVSI
jgi:hypothetical protein